MFLDTSVWSIAFNICHIYCISLTLYSHPYCNASNTILPVSDTVSVHSTDEVDVTLYVIIGVSGAVVVVLIDPIVFVILIISLNKWQNKLRSTLKILHMV